MGVGLDSYACRIKFGHQGTGSICRCCVEAEKSSCGIQVGTAEVQVNTVVQIIIYVKGPLVVPPIIKEYLNDPSCK